MCGCGGSVSQSNKSTSTFTRSTSGACSKSINPLMEARNLLAILFNLTTDEELKAKYKKDRADVENLINQSKSTGVCPDYALVSYIVNEVKNEYTNYYNT